MTEQSAKPSARDFKDVKAVWAGGLAFEATPTSGFTVRMDGDARSGVSPVELVLIGLAGCMGGDVIAILEKKRQAVTALEVGVHGRRADEPPRFYTEIEIVMRVIGQNIDPEAVRRAIELSETKYCSVSANLRGVSRITTRFEIEEAEPLSV